MSKSRLLSWRACWAPTFKGWLVLLTVLLGFLFVLTRCINPFLSLTKPVPADLLIVESWLPDYAIKGAVDEFRRGGYKFVITSGQILRSEWRPSTRYKTGADLAAANLRVQGLQTNLVVPVPPSPSTRDRTYASALAVRLWLQATNSPVRTVNVYSLGPHARRTRLLFRKALVDNVTVGVISCPNEDFDPKHWWASSDGCREVIGETIAYLYARLFFWPARITQ
jgi:hypothetical protein